MKIVQLSTSDMGGAGIAAKNLHLQLLNHNINSSFITKVKLGYDIEKHFLLNPVLKKSVSQVFFNRIKNTIKYRFPFFNNDLNYYLEGRQLGYEYFSFPYSDVNLNSIPQVVDADIVHLHWVSDQFVDYKNVFGLNKKYVWTLHDMNPFSGGCHHSDGCTKFVENCNYCFQLKGTTDEYLSYKILNYKIEALKQLKDEQLKIIAPSQWLLNLSKQSLCFRRFEHILIPNVIDYNIVDENREDYRKELGIKQEQIVFLFVAHQVQNVRKGIQLLIKAIDSLPDKKNIILLTIGEKSGLKLKDIKIVELGFVTDKKILKKSYLSADVFLLPSMAENFPNTIVESLLSGTPVIASNVGGIPEQINDKNGILAKNNTVDDWKNALSSFIENIHNYNRSEIKENAKLRYNVDLVLKKHIQVYNSL